MKTIRSILIILAGFCLLMACEKSEDIFSDEVSSAEDLKCGHGNHHGLDQDRYVIMRSTGLKVHYRVIGKGPVNIVFIPGWTNPLEVYTKQFDYFRDKAQSIYIDLPGHGLSDAPEDIEYTMELMADAIYDVIRKEGVHHFVASGFSWGHIPLTQFEIKHPGMITQLILLDVGVYQWPPMTEDIRNTTYQTLLTLTPEAKIAALNSLIPPSTAPEDLLEFGQYFLDFPNLLMANMNYNFLAEEVCQPYPWTIPIMGIFNIMNTGSPKETKIKLFFPGCEIHVLGGDQHVIQWAYHETVNQLMDDFIIDRPGRKY